MGKFLDEDYLFNLQENGWTVIARVSLGNSIFGEYGELYSKDGNLKYVELRKDFHSWSTEDYVSDIVSGPDAKKAFDEFEHYAEEYSAQNNTVAGGF